ncbi:MAG: GTPase domain-containing protein [Gemmataceae bacterium]
MSTLAEPTHPTTDEHASRALTAQLAEDLSWLETHSRQQPDQASQAGRLRLAAAIVRDCIGPFLDSQPPVPLHIAVVGGAGAGKSTVANLLSGATAAEANPQAGFTRHPIAYTSSTGPLTWSGHAGFLGPLRRLTEAQPANLDEDVYQVRRVPEDLQTFTLLHNYVIWDCPDMTTWAATSYVPRLLEICGLADVIIYVASDERYNDEVPTQFLRLLLQSGKPVIVCLMKMKEANAPAFIEHFRAAVLSRLPGEVVACLAIPYLTPEQLADPARQAPQYRIPLINQVAVLAEPAATARRRTVRAGMNYLLLENEQLLSVVRADLAALESWRSLVLAGQVEFDNRYRREYLSSEKFHRFDEALVRLMELLELPGVGRLLSNTLWVVRTPYRLLKGVLNKALSRPDTAAIPEQPVLEGALHGWLDQLRKEAVRRSSTHPVWAHIEKGFHSSLNDLAQQRFQQGFRAFQLGLADEVERTARAIYEDLEKNPALLNTLRGSKFTLEVASITAALAAGGVNWADVILVPLAASITHQLVEWLGAQYVENQREQTRNRQQALVSQYISGPLAEWLAQWPATGGSAYERLQQALRRIPPAVQQLDALVTERLREEGM